MLAADPTSVTKKAGADAGIAGQGRNKSASVADSTEALATAAAAAGRAASLSSRATGAFFRQSVLGKAAAGGEQIAPDRRANAVDTDGAATLDIEDLLRKAAALIGEVERSCGQEDSSQLLKTAAASPSAPRSPRTPTRVGEADILRQGVAMVSTEMISATGSSASASWGGVRDLDEASFGAERRWALRS
jgi:hypothetical protein